MLKKLTVLLFLFFFLAPVASAALKNGDRVEAIRSAQVHTSPGGTIDDGVIKGELGRIVAGPRTAKGYSWFNIIWDQGAAGWSNANRLKLYAPTASTTPTTPTVPSTNWTTKQILADIRAAEAIGAPITSVLPEKITKEADKNGFKFVDGSLSFNYTVPATVTNFSTQGNAAVAAILNLNPVTLDLGRCRIPIPEGSLIGSHTGTGTISGVFDNTGTYVDFKSTAAQTSFALGVMLDLKVGVDFGLEWCGTVFWPIMCKVSIPNPACPPPICVPDPRKPWKKKCYTPSCPVPTMCIVPILKPETKKESWIDWTKFNVSGKTAANIEIALDHKFVAIGSGKIQVQGNVKLSGGVKKLPNTYFTPVRPDTRLIETPIGNIPHVPKAPILQVLIDQINTPLILAQVFGIDEKLVNKELKKALAEQEEKINNKLKSSGPIEISFPVFSGTDPDSLELREYVFEYLRETLGIFADVMVKIVDDNFAEIMYYILTDNETALRNLFTPTKICPLVEKLKQTMTAVPLYKNSGTCTAVDPKTAASGTYYSDTACTKSIIFQSDEFVMFCKDAMALPNPNKNHGNAAAWPAIGVDVDPLSRLVSPASKWSLSAGAQLGIGVESIKTNNIPYMKRINYKTVNGCSLEMRVYKKDLDATGLKPLMWIHGGSWSQRGAYLGLEALVSSYTEDGFVVFAPYYRLAANNDGSPECRNAKWTEVVSDVESALTWVEANSASFGSPNTGKIAITGQSAGGHLAGWLVAHRPADVSQAMLIYPPADFGDFLTKMQGAAGSTFGPLGTPTAEDGTTKYSWLEAKGIVESAFGIADALKESITSPVVALNSFGAIVKRNGPASHPPVMIIHGGSDSLLHYSQSVALCEGYGGTATIDWTKPRTTHRCGASSYLHLIKEANHAFEICPPATAGAVCLAGESSAARLYTADSLKKGRAWLLDPRRDPNR